MNPRIQQLAEQAEISRLEYNPYTMMTERIQEFDKQKFAELIVRECLRMCDCADVSLLEHNRPQEASGASSVKQFIAEHFGVEE